LKFRIISKKEEISTIDENEEFVHLTFRPSMADIINLLERTPDLKIVQIPQSYNKTLSKGIDYLLEMKNVILSIGDVWGHRTDIYEFFDVAADTMKKMSDEGMSPEEISRKMNISEVIVKYLTEKHFLDN